MSALGESVDGEGFVVAFGLRDKAEELVRLEGAVEFGAVVAACPAERCLWVVWVDGRGDVKGAAPCFGDSAQHGRRLRGEAGDAVDDPALFDGKNDDLANAEVVPRVGDHGNEIACLDERLHGDAGGGEPESVEVEIAPSFAPAVGGFASDHALVFGEDAYVSVIKRTHQKAGG